MLTVVKNSVVSKLYAASTAPSKPILTSIYKSNNTVLNKSHNSELEQLWTAD